MKTNLTLDVPSLEFAAKKIRILTHPDRVRIIELLNENEKLNVSKIYEKLHLIQALTSFNLGILKEYGLVKKVRQGKMSIYSLDREVLDKILQACEELAKR